MSYLAPSVDDFKTQFMAFADTPDAAITSALAEGASYVDDSWINQLDFTQGRMLYAAHVLTLNGHGTGAESEAAKAGTLGVTSIKSADLTISRDVPSDVYQLTQYGKRFKELQRRNCVRVVCL